MMFHVKKLLLIDVYDGFGKKKMANNWLLYGWHCLQRHAPLILPLFCQIAFISNIAGTTDYSKVWNRCSTLNKHSPPPKNFNIRILIHFYINQGISVIFQLFFYYSFSKINKRIIMFTYSGLQSKGEKSGMMQKKKLKNIKRLFFLL